jgi:hypothetical protein
MFNIEEFPQNKKGHNIFGASPGKYEHFENHYTEASQEQINGLLEKIEKLKANF